MAACWSDMAHRPTCVYRFYDSSDVLLYVGLTMNLEGRLAKHRRRKWWKDVEWIDVSWYDNRSLAKDAEADAIWNEFPLHNIVRPIGGAL